MKHLYIKFSLLIFFLTLGGSLLGQETVRDEFESESYSRNDGTESWSTDWIESNDDLSDNGQIKIRIKNSKGRLLFKKLSNESISRSVDLSSASSGSITLSFSIKTEDLSSSKKIKVEVFKNGSSFTSLGSFSKTNDWKDKSYEIKDYKSSTTTIKFSKQGDDWGVDDKVKIDNVQIAYTLDPASDPDTDGDGINNSSDLDDDNDGILDSDEGLCDANVLINGGFDDAAGTGLSLGNNLNTDDNLVRMQPWSNVVPGTDTRLNLIRVDGPGPNNYGGNAQNDARGGAGIYFDVNSGAGTIYQSFIISSATTIEYSGYFSSRDNNNSQCCGILRIKNGSGLSGSIVSSINNIESLNNSNWTFVSNTVSLPAGTYTLEVFLEDPQNVDELVVRDISCDMDNDGILNQFDLDSDNDGCPDAIEANENVTASQLLASGVIDVANNGDVDSDGVPNLVNTDGAADGTNDDQGQATTPAVITSETVTIGSITSYLALPICEGADINFTAIASGVRVIDFGSTGATTDDTTVSLDADGAVTSGDISDDLTYNWYLNTSTTIIATTRTLSLQEVTNGMDDNVYRVEVSSPNSSCPAEETVTLTVNPKPNPIGIFHD